MNDFDGQTWVAFSDLCGLKTMYEKDTEQAAQALDKFYNAVYDLQQRTDSINSVVVSDCAVFWIDRVECTNDIGRVLDHLKRLHTQMLLDYLIRSTIAYGHFRYQRRLEMPRIRKDMIIGGAYLDAYANNDKIQHGSIVIIKLPESINYRNLQLDREYRDMIKANCPVKGFYEYFWSLRNKGQIGGFLDKRKEIQNSVFQKLKELYSEYETN
jgi:hypothetical protein